MHPRQTHTVDSKVYNCKAGPQILQNMRGGNSELGFQGEGKCHPNVCLPILVGDTFRIRACDSGTEKAVCNHLRNMSPSTTLLELGT